METRKWCPLTKAMCRRDCAMSVAGPDEGTAVNLPGYTVGNGGRGCAVARGLLALASAAAPAPSAGAETGEVV